MLRCPPLSPALPYKRLLLPRHPALSPLTPVTEVQGRSLKYGGCQLIPGHDAILTEAEFFPFPFP